MGCHCSGGDKSTGAESNPLPVIDKFENATPNATSGSGGTSNPYALGVGNVALQPIGVTYPDSGPTTDGRPISPNSLNGQPGTKVYIARYAYQARTTEDLSFEKGERLIVVGMQESDWWMAKSMKSQREGYIPRNYVAEAESYEAEE